MANVTVPTCSTAGWIQSSIAEQVDRLFAYFLESDSLQTSLYVGNITNLQDLINSYGRDQATLSTQMERALTTYFSRHYDAVTFEVSITIPNDDGRMVINVFGTITNDGKSYTLSKLFAQDSTNTERFVLLNNG